MVHSRWFATEPHQPSGERRRTPDVFDTAAAPLGRWTQTPTKGLAVSDTSPTPEPGAYPPVPPAPPAAQPGAYPPPATETAAPAAPAAYPPPAQGAYPPPAYGTPASPAPYGTAPAYGAAPGYAAAPGYGYGAPAKTNTLAIVSLIASIASFVILPLVGSIVGVITGHMSLKQLKTSGEQGRGMALAGTIVGWVGIGLTIIGIVAFVLFFVAIYSTASTYSGGYGS
ncbi:DUF4190 domain-containing protein [Microbacterium sp. NEAU-LLC]|uniref:DUF4190 domain-containing protein n=1 Tax=Microbacterium helvum TaxID=2773713 RepID=A0ABR8NK82_9MICO|nr:DUF4190 domain-containing protein [Microbacterium helvum]